MGTALRFLLIAIVIWYVVRYLIPALFGLDRKKETSRSQKESGQYRKSTRQGNVTITDYVKRKKDVKPGDDDYVDYEEVK